MTMKVTRRSQIPSSRWRYNPTDVELVNILHRRIEREKRSSFITDIQNLYEKEPWLLQHVSHVQFYENEWFYFVTRQKHPRIKKADSKTPSRTVGGSGRWKTNGALTHIKNKDGVEIGSMKSICFEVKSEIKKDGITTGWVMHEFVLNKPGFQEVALCRIRFHPRKDNAQYAPRLTPIMIGLEQEDGSTFVENNSENHHGVAAAGEELQYSDAPVETRQARDMERWTGSWSGEVVSYSASQHQDSNYPISNGGMEQYGQGFRDMVEFEYQNQYLGQETTDPRHVPMMVNQALNEEQQWNGSCSGEVVSYSASQHQDLNYPISNGGMEQYGQGFGDMVQFEYQNQYLGQETTDPRHVPMMVNQALNEEQQWNGSCSGEVVSYSASQHQDLNYPISNGGMEQYGQGFGDMVEFEYQNQYLGGQETTDPRHVPMMVNQALNEEQQWNGYSVSSSAHQYLGQDMVPMTQCSIVHHQEQQLAAQRQHFSANGSMEQYQYSGSSGQFLGESSGQQQNHTPERQATYLPLREQQCQNKFWGKETNSSHPAQAMEKQQPWNGYSGLFSTQPYYQGMMEHQDFGSSSLCLAQNHQYLGQNNDLSAPGELSVQQQHLGEDSNLSLTQQRNQILGQTDYQRQLCGQRTDLSQVSIMMNQALEEQQYVPWPDQLYDQYKSQNNALPTVPLETQQQQDNVIRNSAAQLQLEEQDNFPLIDEIMEEPAMDLPMNQGVDDLHGGIVGHPNFDEWFEQFLDEPAYEEMDLEIANFENEEWAQQLGRNTPEEEAELTAALANCNTPKSLLNFLLSD